MRPIGETAEAERQTSGGRSGERGEWEQTSHAGELKHPCPCPQRIGHTPIAAGVSTLIAGAAAATPTAVR